MTAYLFALVDGGGTVPPELAAARRLVERGHLVTVLAEDSMEPDVRATGAEFRPWVEAPNRPDRRPEHDPYRDWEVASPRKLFDRLLELQFVGPARRYIADVDAAIAERRPDLVVCSQFAFGAMTAAEAAGIPFDVLMPNIYMIPSPGMTPIGMGTKPARGPLGRTRDRMILAVMQRVWDKGRDRLDEVRAECGLPPVRHFMDQARAARRHLIMTSADFDFPGRLPDNARYVGPVLDDPTWTGTEAWTAPAGTDPLVLVSLSSTFQDHEATLQRIVDAMGTLRVRAVVTTGPAIDPSSITAAPNVTVVAAAPHRQVLAEAAAIVTHGGHGTVVKALAAGVPLVVLPHGRDQADNAVRVSTRRAGVTLKRTARPAAIADAVRKVLDDPGYRDAAGRLGAAIRSDAAGSALVDELEAVEGGISGGGRSSAPGRRCVPATSATRA
ncbi:MAG: glycosyltransferase [Ilumatobacteraceae bacterium]